MLATLAVAGVLAVASVLLIAFQLNSAVGHLDEMLSDEAEAIGASVELGTSLPMLFDDDRVLIVFDGDGEVVMSAGDDYLELAAIDIVTEDDKGIDVNFSNQRHRVVSEPYTTADGRLGRVVLAEPRDELDESVDRLIKSLAFTVPGMIIALAIVTWVVVGRTLRPVERIRAEVAAISITQLDRRVPEPSSNDEIAKLADTMNDMLSRLERSVRRQQQFVADASHELRTPLTRMRTQLEVEERDPGATDTTRSRRVQLEEIRGLQAMIDDLLMLARTDAGDEPPRETIDLDDIVLDELAAERSALHVDASGVSAAQVIGARDHLRRAVRNVLDNARRHARSAIAVTVEERGDEAVVVVDDDGPGIPVDRRQDALQRFTRLDPSRAGNGRSGLGLAIVSEIVTRHGGTIEILDSDLGGARVQLSFPKSS